MRVRRVDLRLECFSIRAIIGNHASEHEWQLALTRVCTAATDSRSFDAISQTGDLPWVVRRVRLLVGTVQSNGLRRP